MLRNAELRLYQLDFVPSTSDSASTQKQVSKLIEECREEDEAKFGPATIQISENFFLMHLGGNLCKAF